MTTLKALRRSRREAREALPDSQRSQLNRRIAEHVLNLPLLYDAHHVAGYLACKGEFDPATILLAAAAQDKRLYLPVLIGRKQPMRFAPYRPGDELVPNWFGIPEPPVSVDRMSTPERLDLVITPIVGFDQQGFRLGMAGGYYDRSFAFRQTVNGPPWLIGVGYELQKIPPQQPRDWDVRLDGMVTEAGLYRFNPELPE